LVVYLKGGLHNFEILGKKIVLEHHYPRPHKVELAGDKNNTKEVFFPFLLFWENMESS
jgi:hypothetical protein